MTAPTQSEKDRVVIFDTTLRDGEQSPGATMTHEEKLEVAEVLDAMGVDIIEAGFPIASEGDFHHLGEKLELGARCILGRELHVRAQLARPANAGSGEPQDLLLRHIELVLAVDGARREKHVQTPALGGGERSGRQLDVLIVTARERTHDRTLNLARHGLDALEVPARCRREAGLDDIDTELGERACHP